jgi:signal transduction histidine kinase
VSQRVGCRNPLHALSGSANFIKESCKPDDAIYEDVSIIVSGALQMSRLLVSIMDWTKVSVGQLELHPVSVAVTPFLRELVSLTPLFVRTERTLTAWCRRL